MRTRALLLAALLVLSLIGTPALASNTDDVADYGTDHDLGDSSAISEFNADGETSTDLTRIDMTVTVADNKDAVGLSDELTPTDFANDFARFEYNEEAERTVRILVPKDYWTPYDRETVDAITTDHTADFESVRGGDYQSIVIRFDGPADVVFPAEWVASFSYSTLERVDTRLNNSIGITLRDDNSQWEYVNSSSVSEGPGYGIGEPVGDVTVQYDATPDSPEETWINAPEGETLSDDIYYYQRDSQNESAYIVSKTDSPPDIRYNVDSSFTDRVRGDLNELRNIPNKIRETFGGGFFG